MDPILLLDARAGTAVPDVSTQSLEPFETDATVHLVGFDPAMELGIVTLIASVGLGTSSHAHLGAFAAAERPAGAGCVLVRARSALTGVMDMLTRLLRNPGVPPMVVVADRADVRMAVLAMKAGAVDFLEHPLRDHDVLEALGRALRIDYARRLAEAPRQAWQARFAGLTPRERQVMLQVARGRLNKQIAGDLGLSEVTVKVHRASAMRKMGARTLADLVRMADAVACGSEFGAQHHFDAAPARVSVHAVPVPS